MFASLRFTVPGFLCVLLASQTGCVTLSALMGQKRSPTLDTTLLEMQGYSVPPGGMPSPVAPPNNGQPRVILEIRGDERHIESIPLVADQPLFLEDLVQQAKLHEHFGNLNISIMRPNGPGQPPVRLDACTNSKGRATSVGHNYALRNGDHLIVLSDERSSLEKYIEKHFSTGR
ncbi:MAG: hypothetical protein R3C53_13285 [Pirellulaceae bacterium]